MYKSDKKCLKIYKFCNLKVRIGMKETDKINFEIKRCGKIKPMPKVGH